MNDKPVTVARELVQIYGISLLEDPERLGQLLEDKCGDSRHEIFLLSFALRDIMRRGPLPDAAEFGERRELVVAGFCDNLGFSQSSALWAADAISAILSDGASVSHPSGKLEARRGFLDDLDDVDDEIAKRPRTAHLRKKAFRNGFLLLGIMALFVGLFVRITDTRVVAADEHRLLFLAHLSGADAAQGHVRLKGAQLAADQVNSGGGVKGMTLRINAHDVPQNPEEAVSLVEALLKDRRVTAMISCCNDRVNQSLAALADKYELPLIATESGLLGVTMASDERPWLYSFRMSFDDSYSGRIMAYFMTQGLGRKRSALIFHATDKRSVAARDSFVEENEAFGGYVVYESSVGARGLRASDAAEIILSGAEAVIMACGPDSGMARAAEALREAGFDGPILGTGYDELLRSEAGSAIDNSWWILHASPDDPQLMSFRSSYRDKYNEQILWNDFAGTILAYDSVMWMADVLFRSPGFQGEALRHSLLSTRNLALTHATLTVDPRTHAPWNKAVALIYCSEGGKKFQKRFRPK
ncbi:MAG: ABC transporter substrate-binding protein [Synergistaceae bacterium]|nr:ABC transporter substrate-binding protein [Synergistaceae bacterium]